MELALSIAAFVVSAVTLGSTYRIWQLSDRRSRIPVLVFVLVEGKGWVLRNVGNGPALNIVVARKARHGDEHWLDPTSVPPLARDAETSLGWIRKGVDADVLGATYQDFAGADTARPGRTYTAVCANSLSSVQPGRRLPAWTAAQLEPSWQRERRLRMSAQSARPSIQADLNPLARADPIGRDPGATRSAHAEGNGSERATETGGDLMPPTGGGPGSRTAPAAG